MKRKITLIALCVMLVAAVLVMTACQQQQKEVYSTKTAEQQRAAKENAASQQGNKSSRILADDDDAEVAANRKASKNEAEDDDDSELSVESQNLYNMALAQMKNDAKANGTGAESDPLQEEKVGEWEDIDTPGSGEEESGGSAPSALTFTSEYAGATPVVIDPIDKPTPTPLPEITFSYATYSVPQLGITFEGPSGWEVDESMPNTLILINPDAAADYPARVEITLESVGKTLSKSEITSSVKSTLKSLHTSDYSSFSQSNTAERTVAGVSGVYANYKGTLKDGREVAGRLIKVCINNTLVMIHCTYPKGYTDTYVRNVYDKIRHSIKFEA